MYLDFHPIDDRKHWEPRKCPVCGKMFDPNQHNQKYCSQDCYKVESRKRSKKWYHEHKDQAKKNHDQWIRQNLSKYKKYRREYNATHEDKNSYERNLKWREKNPERYKEMYTNNNKKRPMMKCSKKHGNCYDCFTKDGSCIFE